MTRSTILVNPLGAALLHYRRELLSVLRASGQTPEVVEFLEPSAAGGSRWQWIRQYLRTLLKIRRQHRDNNSFPHVVITWPVLGYFDLLILALLVPGAWLTVHDPVPLVRSIGYGRTARTIARILGSRAKVIVLSDTAAKAVRRALPRATLRVLPHPMSEPTPSPRQREPLTVRVLGQYKADRDLEVLRQISASQLDVVFSVTGRGWPHVEGWEVDDRFVPEDELDDLIRTASVVLIPYRRFFQSGIAVRCLELGTPIVGPRDSTLSELLAATPALLADVEPADWIRAMRSAFNLSANELSEIGAQEHARAVACWARLSSSDEPHR